MVQKHAQVPASLYVISESTQAYHADVVAQFLCRGCLAESLFRESADSGHHYRHTSADPRASRLQGQFEHRPVHPPLGFVERELGGMHTNRQTPSAGVYVVPGQGSLMAFIQFQTFGQGQRMSRYDGPPPVSFQDFSDRSLSGR